MISLGLGAGFAFVVAILAVASTIVALAALKDSRPDERAEILMALAVFVAAMFLRFRPLERRSTKSLLSRESPPSG